MKRDSDWLRFPLWSSANQLEPKMKFETPILNLTIEIVSLSANLKLKPDRVCIQWFPRRHRRYSLPRQRVRALHVSVTVVFETDLS